jgi:hypothetical protein
LATCPSPTKAGEEMAQRNGDVALSERPLR